MKSLEFAIPPNNLLWDIYSLSKGRNSYSSGWYGGGFYYMIPLYGPKNKKLRPTTISFYTCREEVIQKYIRHRLRRNKKSIANFDKTRVIVFMPTNIYETNTNKNRSMGCSLKALNTVEKVAGWPLSKVWELTNDKFKDGINFYYFEGCHRWVHSPQMLSCYMLFIRAYKNTTPSMEQNMNEIKTIAGLKKFWTDLVNGSDHSRIREVLVYLPKIIKNYSKLFGNRDMLSLYSPNDDNTFFNEGIQRMIKCATYDPILLETWNKVKNEK